MGPHLQLATINKSENVPDKDTSYKKGVTHRQLKRHFNKRIKIKQKLKIRIGGSSVRTQSSRRVESLVGL